MPRDLPLRFWIISLCALVVANVAVYRAVSAPRVFTVSVSDTGKGRAALVRTPGGKTLLVDTGPDAGILRTLGMALPAWQRSLDAVVLTGGGAKSAGGLSDIRDRYRVARIVHVGGRDMPYGASLIFGANVSIAILAPGMFSISYGATSLAVSSTTSPGLYAPAGKIFVKKE